MTSPSLLPPPDGKGTLILVPRPRADIFKFFTVPPEQNAGVTVEKYTTKYGTTYEKHIQANGVTQWYRLFANEPSQSA